MKINIKKQIRLSLFFLFPFAFLLLSGCIRLTGSAGYWKQGAEDEAPQSKQVGFDTNDYVPGAPAPGNITKGDS